MTVVMVIIVMVGNIVATILLVCTTIAVMMAIWEDGILL
jgi:hypothetical protein